MIAEGDQGQIHVTERQDQYTVQKPLKDALRCRKLSQERGNKKNTKEKIKIS